MRHNRWLAWTLAILLAGLAIPRSARAAQPGKTNLLFILADDLGYGDLGCYGQREIQTPHIDRLARQGVIFTACYAGSTVCAPSRCVLMTGRHTGHCTVRGNALVPLRENELTVARLLHGAGYATGLVGKWGLGEPGTSGIPRGRGSITSTGISTSTTRTITILITCGATKTRSSCATWWSKTTLPPRGWTTRPT